MRPKPADAYLVCGLDCPHEYMAKKATDVWSDGDINAFWNDIQSGITHEDGYDHVYGLNASLVLIGEPFLTATHFWNADLGEGAPAKNALPLGEFQNSLQKVRAYWSLALGAYADGDKGGAYHYLGHIIHHLATTRSRRTFTTTRMDRSRSTTTHSTTGWTRGETRRRTPACPPRSRPRS